MNDYSSSNPYYTSKIPKFSEISAFFGLCGKLCKSLLSFCTLRLTLEFDIVWLVPFALFVSLTAGENVLPSTSEVQGPERVGSKTKSGPGMAKMVVDGVKDWFAGLCAALGWKAEASRRRFD